MSEVNTSPAASYVYDHVPGRSGYVQADAHGCGHRLEYHVDVPGSGVLCRVTYSPDLHLCAAFGDADYHLEVGCEEGALVVDHLDESPDHLLGGVEVGDDSVAQGADGLDVGVRLLVHQLGFLPDCYGLAVGLVKRYYRWFVHDYLAVLKDDGVGRAQVHCQFLCQK